MVADSGPGSEQGGGEMTPGNPPRYSLANSYSLFVGFMKLALPAIGIGLLLLIVIWPQFMQEGRLAIESLEVTEQDLTSRKMLNPRYESYDSDERPFNITADLAEQDPQRNALINLTAPKARLQMDSGKWVSVDAPKGTYNEKNEIIRLDGGVNLLHDDGMTIDTQKAMVDVKNGVAESNTATTGVSDKGTLEGEGFRIVDEGRVIILKGKSKVVLYEQTSDSPASGGAAATEDEMGGTGNMPAESGTQ